MRHFFPSRGKKNRTSECFSFSSRRHGFWFVVAILFLSVSCPVLAAPTGGVVAAGSATISTPTATTMQINQTTNKAVINWQTYNIAAKESVHYQQPSASSISLNRINAANGPSKIYGNLSSNGRVWLVNGAGIWFGPTAHVDVGGLIATTANISDHDFMSGNYRFLQAPSDNGAIINEGQILIRDAGLAALVGSGAVNNGYIEAEMGTVILAASTAYTVRFDGSPLIEFATSGHPAKLALDQNQQPLTHAVSQTGNIRATGGKILISAHTASQVLDHAINMTGVAEANSVNVRQGVIILDAGNGKTQVSGKLYAAGKKAGEKGG